MSMHRHSVYLDHNATTEVRPEARVAMVEAGAIPGNPSSVHRYGRLARRIIEDAREAVADLVGAEPAEVVFTSGGSEANALALRGTGRTRILVSAVEHASVLQNASGPGVLVETVPVDAEGVIDLRQLELALAGNDRPALVSLMAANNETGVIQDIAAITRSAHQRGALVLTDCVQALGKIPVQVHQWGVDYASFSAHKLYGPKGVGALYVRQGRPFAPLLHGGHQESGLRAGTESLHNLVGFGAACQDVERLLTHARPTQALKQLLIERLRALKPDCVINSAEAECLPNTLSVTFPGVENAGLMAVLDYRGVAVSAGSACSTGEDKPSHVLKALGLSDQAARETIRLSLGWDTTAGDIHYAADVIGEHLAGRTPLVDMLAPAQLNETILFSEDTFVLDVRPPDDRRRQKGLPNAHEVSPLAVEKYLRQLPRDKRLLVYCPGGGLSFMVSYYLKAKGFKRVTNLRGGLDAWRKRRGDLYEKYAGQNVTVLQPDPTDGAA